MPAGDVALRVLITGSTDTFLSSINFLGGTIRNVFSGLGNSIGNLAFGFRNLSTEGTIGMDAIKQGASGLGVGLLQLTAILAAAAAVAVVAIGINAVKAAGDFQASMTRLITSAGELPQNLQMVSSGILQMSVDTATSTDQLAAGMYYVESAGHHGADALKVLGAAAMGAKSENADLIVVSKALTGVLTDYHMNVNQSANAMNGLIATVQNGKTNLQDLSNSMGNVLPIASALHISFAQVAGSMDTMTNANMNARQASQNLAHVLLALSAPSGVAVKSMTAVGLSAQGVKDALVNQGLPQALQMIEDHVGQKFPKGSVAYEAALKNILGGIVGFKLAAMLTGKSLAETQTNIDKITAAMKGGGGAVLGWDEVQKTFNFHLDQAKEAFNVLLIVIGNKLLPILGNILGAVTPLISAFTNWVASGHVVSDTLKWMGDNAQIVIPILAGLATAVLYMAITAIPPMLVALAGWAADAWAAAAGMIALTWPVLLVIAAVAGLAAIFVALYKNNAGFRAFVDNLWNGMKQLWQVVVSYVQPAWNAFVSWLKGPFISALQAAWQWVSSVFVAGWKATVAWFQGTFLPAMQRVGQWFMTTIWPVMVQIWQFLVATFVPVWQQLVSTWNNQLLPAFAAIGQVIRNQLWPVLQQLWATIQSQLWPVLQQLWGVIQNNLWPALKQLWPVLEIIGGIIGGIVVVAFVMLMGVIAGVVRAVATLISGIVQFVGGVVQFFAGLWQTVAGIVQLIVDLVTGHFDKLGQDLGQIWSGIQNMWNGLWAAVNGIFKAAVGTLVSYVQGFFSTVVGIFTNLYNTLVGHSLIPDLVNGAISWFAQLLGKPVSFVANMVANIIGKLGDLLGQGIAKVSSFVSGLASRFGQAARDAVSWGSNIVNAILRGLQAAWGAVTGWLGGALAGIRNMFPHSPVKEGPLMGLENWGSNIVGNLVASMRASTPQLTSAANAMALAVNGPLGSSGFAVKGGSFALSGKNTVVVQIQAGDINLDKRKVGDILFAHQAREARITGPVKNR